MRWSAATSMSRLFIGEPGMIERGHGSALIRAFADERLAQGAPRMVTDPDPTNRRAVRAYTPHGGSLLFSTDTLAGKIYLTTERLLMPRGDLYLFESSFSAGESQPKLGTLTPKYLIG